MQKQKDNNRFRRLPLAINFSGSEFYDSLIDIVGYKCGVALARPELKDLLTKIEAQEYAGFRKNDWVRIDSATYEEIVYALLKAFGRLEPGFSRFPSIDLYHESKNDKKAYALYRNVMSLWTEWMNVELRRAKIHDQKLLDPTPLLLKVLDKHGRKGYELIVRFLEKMNAAMVASPWGNLRQVEWRNQIELRDLFESEGLNAEYGNFIDQRYIDFLHANFADIDKMHWRKFEQLTAEFLDRSGYRVELGPGRGDDGVDVRAWSKEGDVSRPSIIVQCKRQKDSVGKTVIKSLYADVIHAAATSGLLVTTSRISPGAEQTRSARAYPIDVADRVTLREWLKALRVPGVGDFQPTSD
jgi:restriction system protein